VKTSEVVIEAIYMRVWGDEVAWCQYHAPKNKV